MVRDAQPPSSPSALLRLIRSRRQVTRSSIVDTTGLSRTRITELLTPLLGQGFVTEARGSIGATGGRPPSVLSFNPGAGSLALVDLAARPARVAFANLSGRVIAEVSLDVDLRTRPEEALERVEAAVHELHAGDEPPTWALGVAVPEPVALGTNFPVGDWLRERFDVPVVVEREVNAATLAEHRAAWAHVAHLLYVQVGHGVSCGIVTDHQLHRGHSGTAGGIAHIRLLGSEAVCWCGSFGCLEAAVEATLHRSRFAADASDDALQRAGHAIGEALTLCVTCLNPELVVIAGATRRVEEQLLLGTRAALMRHGIAATTRGLELQPAQLGPRASTAGLALLTADALLADETLDASLAVR